MKLAHNLYKKLGWTSVDIKITKAKFWRIYNYPFFYFQSKKWGNGELFKEIEKKHKLSAEKIEEIVKGIPKAYDDNRLTPSQLIQNHLDEETLKNDEKVLYISKQISKELIYSNTFVAKDFLERTISLSKKLYGRCNPDLIELYHQRAEVLQEIGDMDELYRNINECFLLTLLNYKFDTVEMARALDNFRHFSLIIEEMDEHELYSNKIEIIINKLLKDEKEKENVNLSSLTFIYYLYMKLLDGSISFPEKNYTVDQLKKIFKKFNDLQKDENFSILIKNTQNYNEKSELLYHILYCNIKITHFFKKEVKENILKEMNSLIHQIKTHLSLYNYRLIYPYLFLAKFYMKQNEKDKLDHLIYEDWSNLVENLCDENLLLIANYTLKLVYAILTKEKDYKFRIGNLIDVAGENYNKIFNFEKNPSKFRNNFWLAETCYLGGLVCRDEQKMQPWDLVGTASEIYLKVLGPESEKYKKAVELIKEIERQYNLNKNKE